jgi:hypothetical protein
VLLSFRGEMERSHVDDLFFPRVVDPLVEESQRAQNDQQNAEPTEWFHVHLTSIVGADTGTAAVLTVTSMPDGLCAELSQKGQLRELWSCKAKPGTCQCPEKWIGLLDD